MAAARFIGVDGFKGGWVAAWIDASGKHDFTHAASLRALFDSIGPFKRAMIDIPLGLPSSGYRQCDIEARQKVGSSVFLGARRGLLEFSSQSQATATYHSKGEPGVAIQLWSLVPKLREADVFIRDANRGSGIFEAHPEAAFFSMNGGVHLENKKKPEGRIQRIALLEKAGFSTVSKMLSLRRGTGIKSDDLIDACVCAVVARDSACRLPRDPQTPKDDCGVAMQIWY